MEVEAEAFAGEEGLAALGGQEVKERQGVQGRQAKGRGRALCASVEAPRIPPSGQGTPMHAGGAAGGGTGEGLGPGSLKPILGTGEGEEDTTRKVCQIPGRVLLEG